MNRHKILMKKIMIRFMVNEKENKYNKRTSTMEGILNEVELRKERREQQQRDQLKMSGLKNHEIDAELEKKKKKAEDEKKEVIVCRTTTDVMKRKIDRLMKDPSREAYIPQPRKEWKPREAPEFVRHVMGSSAGAGSGEFHVYRNLRKREAKRQEYLDKKSVKDTLEEEFHDKVEMNKKKAEDETAKKRAKRQRKKQKKKLASNTKKGDDKVKDDKESESENEEDCGSNEEGEEESHFVIGGK